MRKLKAAEILHFLDVVVGDTAPYGDSAIDADRMENLKTLIDIGNWVLDSLAFTTRYKERHEWSMRNMAMCAEVTLKEWKKWIASLPELGDEDAE